MKILYATDIHGNHSKYRKLLEIAQQEKVYAMVFGGDMLPKTGGDLLSSQKRFLQEWFGPWMMEVANSGIHLLVMPGNDDLIALDEEFDQLCQKHALIHNITRRLVTLDGYEFIGMDLVCDYPFRLKDRCRLDYKDVLICHQFGTGITSHSGKLEEIADWPTYVMNLPTMRQELDALPKPIDYRRTVYVIHQPPLGLGLDVLNDGRCVGSRSVTEFLSRAPLLTLHGHIHESPDCSGTWRWHAKIIDTYIAQPGQRKELVYLLIDLESMNLRRTVSRV